MKPLGIVAGFEPKGAAALPAHLGEELRRLLLQLRFEHAGSQCNLVFRGGCHGGARGAHAVASVSIDDDAAAPATASGSTSCDSRRAAETKS